MPLDVAVGLESNHHNQAALQPSKIQAPSTLDTTKGRKIARHLLESKVLSAYLDVFALTEGTTTRL